MTIRSGVVGKTGRIRLTGKALEDLRRACFERDGYRCQHHIAQCGPFYQPCRKLVTWESGHMAHIKSRGAGGSDTLDNVVTKCAQCHLVLEHNPKSVPPKQQLPHC